jgi:hypothetical protein
MKMSQSADVAGRLRGYAPSATMRDDDTSQLPPGYSLDLVDDPDLIILRRSDGTVVARFTRAADPKEIRRAAEEDTRVRGGRRDD